ncbi:hypothetical protein QWA_18167 [Alcaligenes faecalis subsp. faecalis NCIB 8687]|nr:hypothetical protein QWA_18167 [Alcaligenes faecalis subsp. faecalis NCIB 8687]
MGGAVVVMNQQPLVKTWGATRKAPGGQQDKWRGRQQRQNTEQHIENIQAGMLLIVAAQHGNPLFGPSQFTVTVQ